MAKIAAHQINAPNDIGGKCHRCLLVCKKVCYPKCADDRPFSKDGQITPLMIPNQEGNYKRAIIKLYIFIKLT